MPRWKWTERTFRFDFPPEKFADLLERWRGAPPRIEELVRGVPSAALARSDGGWSIKQNIGHLIDLGYLPLRRLEQILAGERDLVAADMQNRRTNEADHNGRPVEELLSEFRAERMAAAERFAALAESDWSRSGIHPRLGQPMRVVDLLYFDSEHDDYHIARIAELVRRFAKQQGE